MYLPGGNDSFNMLVPTCNSMYSEYKKARGSHAMPQDKLLPLDASGSGQVCDTFGLHEKLPTVKELYDAGDASFVANMGLLSKPLTKHDNWHLQSKPAQLFAHNTMTKHALMVDIKSLKAGSGVGGRMLDMLKKHGYQTSPATVDGLSLINIGDQQYGNPYWTISPGGGKIVDIYSSLPGTEMLNKIAAINGNSLQGNSIFGETWSATVAQALHEYETQKELDSAMESGDFNMNSYRNCGGVCGQLRAVAGYIKGRSLRKVDREFFFVKDNESYDMHRGDGLDERYTELDGAIKVKFC